MLNVDEIQCVHIWNSYLRGFILDGKQKFDSSQLKSLDTIIQVRDYYFTQLHYTWKILQELIRIYGDNSHVYNNSVTDYITKLLEKYINLLSFNYYFINLFLFRNLIQSLLSSIEKLNKWEFITPNVILSSYIFFFFFFLLLFILIKYFIIITSINSGMIFKLLMFLIKILIILKRLIVLNLQKIL